MTLSDSLTIDPGKMTVTAGVPVRFVVTNDGALEHDFFIGTDKEQKQREAGTASRARTAFIAVPPGETVELRDLRRAGQDHRRLHHRRATTAAA